ncbi:GDP-mannose transporter [Nematocida homosporus]|uniref:GDP-mannose transporter n=1 Tax=Nematocida homosporus TaxID=1912981 RepID=UPI002220C485|nr:GDP-mannose transporter [Nematocida homosporus]KAI5185768.1 GDP-mannose transporter [Nematocida homosporus]
MLEQKASIIVFMVLSGIASTVMNKYLVSRLQIKTKFFILSVQTLVILVVLLPLNLLFFPERTKEASQMISQWFWISASLTAMVYTGLQANTHLSISLFTVLKNGSILIIAAYDWNFNQYQITGLTVASFGLIVLSSLLGTVSDSLGKKNQVVDYKQKEKLLVGLAWVAVNCTTSASYTIRLRMIGQSTGLPSTVIAMYANSLALPFIGLCTLGEYMSMGSFPFKHLWVVVLSGLSTALIAVSTAMAAANFTSTTVAMINALNKAPISLSGVLFRFEQIESGWKWLSLGISAAAGISYALSRSSLSMHA